MPQLIFRGGVTHCVKAPPHSSVDQQDACHGKSPDKSAQIASKLRRDVKGLDAAGCAARRFVPVIAYVTIVLEQKNHSVRCHLERRLCAVVRLYSPKRIITRLFEATLLKGTPVMASLDKERVEDAARPAGGRSWGKPNPIDVHVGNRLRLRRTLLGMSQQKVGEALGLTFQQVQKYERGTNRIGASRLWDLAGVLDCPVAFFFEEMDEKTAGASPRNWDGQTTDILLRQDDPMNRRETLELVRAYYRIRGYHVRRRIYELAKSLASAGSDGDEADWKPEDDAVSEMPMTSMTSAPQEMRRS